MHTLLLILVNVTFVFLKVLLVQTISKHFPIWIITIPSNTFKLNINAERYSNCQTIIIHSHDTIITIKFVCLHSTNSLTLTLAFLWGISK